MRDYPTIIKNLKISRKMDEIADRLKDRGLILKGTVIPEEDRVIFIQSDNGISYKKKRETIYKCLVQLLR